MASNNFWALRFMLKIVPQIFLLKSLVPQALNFDNAKNNMSKIFQSEIQALLLTGPRP